jgi:hypothetical protein
MCKTLFIYKSNSQRPEGGSPPLACKQKPKSRRLVQSPSPLRMRLSKEPIRYGSVDGLQESEPEKPPKIHTPPSLRFQGI